MGAQNKANFSHVWNCKLKKNELSEYVYGRFDSKVVLPPTGLPSWKDALSLMFYIDYIHKFSKALM